MSNTTNVKAFATIHFKETSSLINFLKKHQEEYQKLYYHTSFIMPYSERPVNDYEFKSGNVKRYIESEKSPSTLLKDGFVLTLPMAAYSPTSFRANIQTFVEDKPEIDLYFEIDALEQTPFDEVFRYQQDFYWSSSEQRKILIKETSQKL